MRSVFSWLLAACLLLVAGADALGARFAGELPQPDAIHRLAVEEAESYPDGLPFDPKFEYRRTLLEQAGFSILAGDSDSKVLHALLLKEFFPNEQQTPVLGYKGEHAKGSLRHHTEQARQILWSNETRYLPEHEAVKLASHLVKSAETSSYVTTNALQRERQIMEGIMMVPEGLILAAGWTPAGRGVAVPKQVATRAIGTGGAGTLTKMMTRGAARTGAQVTSFADELAVSAQAARRHLSRAVPGQGGQVHHIIAWQSRNHELVQRAARGGFNINGANNGIRLQTTQHLGSHPRYNAAIQSKMDSILRANPNISDIDAARAVQAYVDQLRAGLMRSTNQLR